MTSCLKLKSQYHSQSHLRPYFVGDLATNDCCLCYDVVSISVRPIRSDTPFCSWKCGAEGSNVRESKLGDHIHIRGTSHLYVRRCYASIYGLCRAVPLQKFLYLLLTAIISCRVYDSLRIMHSKVGQDELMIYLRKEE